MTSILENVGLDGLLLGIIIGMTYGILAVGLVLIYRSSKIINFAHGEIGVFGAAVLGVAVIRWHVPYWIAFALALVCSAGVAAIVEMGVVRRLRRAPKLMTIVATLGAGQFIFLLSLAIGGTEVQSLISFPEPSGLPRFHVGALTITPAHSGMLFLTPLLVVALTAFLLRSRYGLAIRGSAANPEMARLVGLSSGRMSTLAWSIAGAVSAFTALLVLPARGGLISGETLGPALLMRALAAAVIGRMTSLPLAFAAGIAIGVLEVAVTLNVTSGGLVEMVLLVVVLGALLLQTRREGREEEKGSWTAVQPWPPLPEAVLKLASIRNLGRVATGLGIVGALALPVLATNRVSIIFVSVIAFALIGTSLGVITGLSGQLSLGQFALAGIGATVSALISRTNGNFALSFVAAGVATAVVSLVLGIPALRIRGLMLAVSTLSFALASQSWLLQQPWMLGSGLNPGRPIIGNFVLDTGKKYYIFTLVFLLLGMWLYRNLRRGAFGRSLIGIRDNEEGARAFTIPVTMRKLQAFATAGFLAGLGGAVYGHSLSSISFQTFSARASIDLVAMTVIGGIGIVVGPLLGALYLLAIPAFVPLDSAGLAATALGWLILILYFPGGIAQLVRPLRDRLIKYLAGRAGLDPRVFESAPGEASITAPTPRKLGLLGRASQRLRAGRMDWTRPPRISAIEDPPHNRPGETPWGALVGSTSRGPVEATPDEQSALLEVFEMHKTFGGVRAVDGVSLSVMKGETLGLIGPNGAGKTTLFELISGFTRPDGGRVQFAGRDVTRMTPEARGRLGLIRSFQDATLFETLTVLDTVALALERQMPTRLWQSALGFRRAEQRKEDRSRDLLALMGLEGYRHKQIRELSTGTRRITELTCVLALEPTLLLLDEPTSGIAQRESEALGGLLERIKRELNTTFMIIEHDMPMIMNLSNRIVAMESGRVLAEGSPDQIRRNSRVVESYLGGDPVAIERSGAMSVAELGDG